MRRFLFLLPFLFSWTTLVHAQGILSDHELDLAVNALGVPLGAPRSPLVTFDGPTVTLDGPVAAWHGFSYRSAPGAAESSFVAEGIRPDWRVRTPVIPIYARTTRDSSLSVVRAGNLLVTTRYQFDEVNPFLTCIINLTNLGSQPLYDLFITQEWGDHPSKGSWSFPTDWDLQPNVPAGIRRSAWMWMELAPGQTKGTVFTLKAPDAVGVTALGVDVPLSLWTSPSFPGGLNFGLTNGISFGDYDQDGYIDVMAMESGNLWHNLEGQDWELALNVFNAGIISGSGIYYGSGFGDYNNDGWPDIATAPRGNWNNLMKNLGGSSPYFFDIADNPALFDLQVFGQDLETIVWCDTDGDANLDYLLPNYPFSSVPGNFFYHNLGPIAAGGEYAFEEIALEAGLKNTNAVGRSEGAQFLDFDFDGDGDLFCNQTFYRNISSPGVPRFSDVSDNTGLLHRADLDEGIVFFDMDLDGDYDLVDGFTNSLGIRIFEALGDGSYREMPTNVVDSHLTGLNLGISAADWDNDGDIDFTTRQVFRRNMFVETGVVKFTVATHSIPSFHLTSATPAWGDWDKDGDLDSALGNWLSSGNLYENTLYDSNTVAEERRYVRVRAMRDSPTLANGLETEYGANVEIYVQGEEYSTRRRQFVTSSAGYLNQSEYVLHFAMPEDPFPVDPAKDSVFDVSVQFTNPPQFGFIRVDRHVNPVLGGLRLADLEQREITVFRSGRVRIEGCDFLPTTSPLRLLTTEGLRVPTDTSALPLPTPTAASSFVGLDFDTLGATGPVRLTEIQLDGQLTDPVSCPTGDFNIVLWDVSTPGSPVMVPDSNLIAWTSSANSRSHLRCDILLQPGRDYRLVAAVDVERHTPRPTPWSAGGVTLHGGLQFQDLSPCDGVAVEGAAVMSGTAPMAVRFSTDTGNGFADLGNGLAGTTGIPSLSISGDLQPGSPITLQLTGAIPNTPLTLLASPSLHCQPFASGTLIPGLQDVVIQGLQADSGGAFTFSNPWPAGLGNHQNLYFQMAAQDLGAPAGFSLSNSVSATSQF